MTPAADIATAELRTFIERTGYDAFLQRDVSSATDNTRAAALTYLRDEYLAPAGPFPDDHAMLGAAAAELLAESPGGSSSFVADILFDVDHPGDYQGLLPVIQRVLSSSELVGAIIDRLEHGTDAQRTNALGLLYYAFGHRDGFRLGDSRDDLVAAVDALRQDPASGPRTTAALQETTVPYDML